MCSTSMQLASTARDLGQEMHRLIKDLYPICRSITGEGLRKSLRMLQKYVPMELKEVPTGTQVFDWTVPPEWNIREAYVKNSRGERVIDFQDLNLHVVSYSTPVRVKMRLAELKKHLFTLPERPDWVPYRTSYYKESWGFCISQRLFDCLPEDDYEIVIDSTLGTGHLTYGECFLPGDVPDEIVVSTHCCHPSMCNDNLSGMAVSAFLAKRLSQRPRRYSYRFLYLPGTIGAITWLAQNESRINRIKHGLVLTGLGDKGKLHYKKSRHGNAEVDRAAAHVLRHGSYEFELLEFSPYGYDERQFCSPGINLPVGRLSRTPHGTFPEYHTSADNLEFVHPEQLAAALEVSATILELLDRNGTFLNLHPKCEPQLGKRGLYGAIGGGPNARTRELAMLWVLNLSDGSHSLLDIAERSQMPFECISLATEALQQNGLLRECPDLAAPQQMEFPERTKL
jgi:aminopeptidase-like protein